MATTTTGAASSTSNYTLPSNLKTTSQYKKEQEEAQINGKGDEMGQMAFLTLFTTQLKNQNPLDPMENEAFVAQLAQFSQLEATTKMSTNIETLVKSMSNSQISNASGMLGRKVTVDDGKALYEQGVPLDGTVALPKAVDGITLRVFDSRGQLVRTGQIGAQKAGEFPFTWDGNDNAGNPVASGQYRIEATTTRFGMPEKAAVTTMATVKSVTTDAATGDMQLELSDRSKVSLSAVKRIGF
jgi:flagellar basal-body rod modification protein FlgD